ncbi:hypothetical protein ACF0H5_010948 [Mactra antiquata]
MKVLSIFVFLCLVLAALYVEIECGTVPPVATAKPAASGQNPPNTGTGAGKGGNGCQGLNSSIISVVMVTASILLNYIL